MNRNLVICSMSIVMKYGIISQLLAAAIVFCCCGCLDCILCNSDVQLNCLFYIIILNYRSHIDYYHSFTHSFIYFTTSSIKFVVDLKRICDVVINMSVLPYCYAVAVAQKNVSSV